MKKIGIRSRPLTALVATALALLVPPAAAQAKDADQDGMGDRWEQRHHVQSAAGDPDGDRVDNRNEFRERSKPRDRDSDNDGRADGREDRDHDKLRNAAEDSTGNDPVDKDTDNDGVIDSLEQAGVVSAYDEATGSLTIDLSNGSSVTGTVTDETDVECISEPAAEEQQGSASASNRGPGGNHRGSCDDRLVDEECPEGTLAVGARVHQAELRVRSNDGAVWVEIEILT
jgi:hypothetical protein